ncbi:hypothetical protein IV454_13510 [Massilia antarctica]|uniref:ATP-grasp domain-containing protein n=1 Tax=Massilia antarctica TaxID=2765360 RepID=A0AA48WHE0_9BURK|nr:hypothetical protein [Massilia antarctica]QPI52407.1 hypothetical protein IV454_13510 [Massilia antarctica]
MKSEKPHVVVINGWSEAWSDGRHSVDSVIDNTRFDASYIVDQNGYKGLTRATQESGRVRVVDDIQSLGELEAAFSALAQQFGPVFRLIAVSEWDILSAATLREKFGIEGLHTRQALAVRDKVAMKTVVGAAGFNIPAYQGCSSVEELRQFVGRHGYPVVLKPRSLMGGRGVKIIASKAQLDAEQHGYDFHDQECEVFHQGTSFHVDGLLQNGQLVYAIAFRNNRPPISFSRGQPLGAISLPAAKLKDKLVAFSVAVARSLELFDNHFHLELILDESDEHAEPVFIEVGARVGGADIPASIEMLTGVDPILQQIRVELQQAPLPLLADGGQSAAYLMIPFPRALPCRILTIAALPPARCPTLVKSFRRQAGDILDGKGGFRKIPARFLMLGNYEDVKRDFEHLDKVPTFDSVAVS